MVTGRVAARIVAHAIDLWAKALAREIEALHRNYSRWLATLGEPVPARAEILRRVVDRHGARLTRAELATASELDADARARIASGLTAIVDEMERQARELALMARAWGPLRREVARAHVLVTSSERALGEAIDRAIGEHGYSRRPVCCGLDEEGMELGRYASAVEHRARPADSLQIDVPLLAATIRPHLLAREGR